MRRTPREDRIAHERRIAAELEELALRYYTSDDTPIGTGEPEDHNRQHKANVNSWDYDQRTGKRRRIVGVATGTEKISDGTPTVRVIHAERGYREGYREGYSEVVPVSQFRREGAPSSEKIRETRENRNRENVSQSERLNLLTRAGYLGDSNH